MDKSINKVHRVRRRKLYLHVHRFNFATLKFAAIDVPRPLTNDLWVFLFQTINEQCVK